jgi:hypothetical protein
MKISHFPDFLPDEMVYSVASRYMDRMQFSSHAVISHHFFGGPERGLVSDLPSSLEHLIQSLPPNHTYTTDIIINRHTLFPYYAPFLLAERALRLKHYMENDNYGFVYATAGIAGGKALRPNWLKYCPICVDYDRVTYGECYWHRIHQAPGVLVCPVHEIMLENSTVSLLHGITVPKFHSAESTITNSSRYIVPSHFHHFLVQLAKNAKWLLDNWEYKELFSLQKKYFAHLVNHGFVTAGGLVRNKKIQAAMSDYYPTELLELIGCATVKTNENWFTAWTEIQHPLHHLLFIQFLCETTEKFFTQSQAFSNPFGKGPWPCLNPLCPHYKDRVITDCTIRRGELGQPSGMFACRCGYIYTRLGPDKDDSAIFHGRVSQYGAIWNQQLTAYWLDQSISSVRQIAKLMHVNARSVCRQAARLNLPFTPDISNRGERPTVMQNDINKKCADYRVLWEEALKANPSGNVSEIIDAAHKAYSWLRRHDPDWLKEHYPNLAPSLNNDRLIKGRAQKKQDYYSQIDAHLAKITKRTAEEIYTKSSFPIQVTRRMLATHVGNTALAKRSDIVLNNLPLTSQVLKEVIETDVTFTWRKLKWAVHSFLSEQTYPPYSTFLNRARINFHASKHPDYKSLIKFAYSKLGAGTLLDKQIPEDLIKRSVTTLSDNEIMREATSGSLASAFMEKQPILLKPSRQKKRNTYELIPILLLLITAILNGAENFSAIATWAYRNEEMLIKCGLPASRFPTPSTIEGRCANLDINHFENILEVWLQENFALLQDGAKAVEVSNNKGIYVPGLRILRLYRHIASEVVAKLR